MRSIVVVEDRLMRKHGLVQRTPLTRTQTGDPTHLPGPPKKVIDGMSVALLKDSQIDWHEDIAGSNFVVKNPNATAMCGCGTSFAVG